MDDSFVGCVYLSVGSGRDAVGLIIYCYSCFSLHVAGFPLVSAVSPLQVDQFAWDLRFHPNRQLVAYALAGLRHGFKKYPRHSETVASLLPASLTCAVLLAMQLSLTQTIIAMLTLDLKFLGQLILYTTFMVYFPHPSVQKGMQWTSIDSLS